MQQKISINAASKGLKSLEIFELPLTSEHYTTFPNPNKLLWINAYKYSELGSHSEREQLRGRLCVNLSLHNESVSKVCQWKGSPFSYITPHFRAWIFNAQRFVGHSNLDIIFGHFKMQEPILFCYRRFRIHAEFKGWQLRGVRSRLIYHIWCN